MAHEIKHGGLTGSVLEEAANWDAAHEVDDTSITAQHFSKTATKVVAANDSDAKGKLSADYVCSDAADDVQIQAAIDALPAGGGKVVLLEGTFTLDATVTLDDYVTLEGQGVSTIVTIANTKNVDLIAATSKTGIVVCNFKIDGNSANQSAGAGIIFTTITESWIHNMRVEDCKGTGIFLYTASDRNLVSNCQVESCGGSGFELRDNCDHNQVINCRSQSNTTNGFYIYASGDDAATMCHYNEFINCYGLDNTTNGIYISHCPLNVITGGHFQGNETGITITDSSECRVVGASVIENDQRGLQVKDGARIEIIGVRAKNNSQDPTNSHEGIILWDTGVLADTGCIVMGCVASDDQGTTTQRYGIRTTNQSTNNIFKGNRITGNTYAIRLIGDNSVDQHPKSTALDLSGAASDVVVFQAQVPCALIGYTIFYTEASSADAGVTVRVGRYQDGVALDDDYFDTSTSEVSKSLGYSKHFVTTDLTKNLIAAGDTVTVGTAGGKTGTGEVMIILQIAEMAD